MPTSVIVIVIFIITVLLLWRLFNVKGKKNGCTKMIASVFAVLIWFPRCRGHEVGHKVGLDENKDAYIFI